MMVADQKRRNRITRCFLGLAIAAFFGDLLPSASAQVIPDNTLGSESSLLTPQQTRQTLIEGGASRGQNLFHSFTEFNVNNGQQVYFANPIAIDNILTRITGNNISQILGTLGVKGDANLFLINPNGIHFGENARLDITGSFFATTSAGILFNNGYVFNANNPNLPPLLALKITPGIQYPNPPQGDITHQGRLEVGGDLTLIGDRLNLQGPLQAGENLTLQARDTLQIRDSLHHPFIASAGRELVLQGDRSLDIFALNHPQSGLFSGTDMVLRSAAPVIGDARYYSRGHFRIEELNGTPGHLVSPNDPIIRASGDVSFTSYTGASLHILAGGSVTIPGDIRITGIDAIAGLIESVPLSNGSTFNIDGTRNPTLDIRAGTTHYGTPGITGIGTFTPAAPGTGGTGTGANIAIGKVEFNNGMPISGTILLTNQYFPNSALTGNISLTATGDDVIKSEGATQGGSLHIDSKNDINIDGNIKLSALMNAANGGNATLLSGNDLTFAANSDLSATGLLGGQIDIVSAGNVAIANSILTTDSSTATRTSSVRGGDISIVANNVFLTGGATLSANTRGIVNAGNISIVATDTIRVDGISDTGTTSKIASEVQSGAVGNAGNISLSASFLEVLNGGTISTSSRSQGNGGSITINASNGVKIAGGNGESSKIESEAGTNAIGNAGDIMINTSSLEASDRGVITTATKGQGNGGNITINATDAVTISGGTNKSIINSEVSDTGVGNAGSVRINANSLELVNDGLISTDAKGEGNAGNITISVNDTVAIADSAIASSVDEEARGNAGNIEINAATLNVTEGGGIVSESRGQGNAGNIAIAASESITIAGSNSKGQRSRLVGNITRSATGNGGQITIETGTLSISDRGFISSNSKGQGSAGDVNITANSVTLSQQATIEASTSRGNGGNLNFTVAEILLLRDNSGISTTAGSSSAGGDGGNININAGFIVAVPSENSDITANAFTGNGGKITIVTNGIFGLEFRDELTSKSDITATSQFGLSGTVSITTLNVNPTQGLGNLSTDFVDPSNLVRQACPSDRAEARKFEREGSRFTVTGRGGIPVNPTDILEAEGAIADWVSLEGRRSGEEGAIAEITSPVSNAIEAQGWYEDETGNLVLTTEAIAVTPYSPRMVADHCSAIESTSHR